MEHLWRCLARSRGSVNEHPLPNASSQSWPRVPGLVAAWQQQLCPTAPELSEPRPCRARGLPANSSFCLRGQERLLEVGTPELWRQSLKGSV